MTRIILSGCNGKMGQAIVKAVADREDAVISAGVDIFTDCGYDFPVFNDFKKIDTEADVIIDFSNPVVLDGLLSHARGKKLPAVICTTGYSTAQVQQIKEAAKEIAVFHSGNMSLGINLIIELSKKAASVFGSAFDIEIVEKHHNQKVDAPSGTALALADSINEEFNNEYTYVYDRSTRRQKRDKKEIGLSAVRGGTIVGDHDVIFAGEDEVITFSHTAYSKNVFAKGAVQAAKFLKGKPAGLYDMSDVIEGV